MYIRRSIENIVIDASNTYPVIMISGARQVGKSTLLHKVSEQLEQKINYVTLDDLKVRKLAVEDPELFLETYQAPLIIDEFQYAKELLSYIKIEVDKKRLENLENDQETKTMYYLTGSQLFHAMEGVSESLAGRVLILDMHPLSNREINDVSENLFIPSKENIDNRISNLRKDVLSLFEKILLGSYPELYSNKKLKKEQFFQSYLQTYIQRDIKEIIKIKDELKFLKFIEMLAVRTGSELVLSDICKYVEINNNTAKEWLSILRSTGLVYLLQPYTKNAAKRIVKRPKLYFMDTGLACYLAGYTDAVTLEKSAFNGAIFETYVITEIIKSFANNGLDPRKYLYYYRDNNQKEIDLLIVYNQTIYPVEIKKNKKVGLDAIKNFSVVKQFGLDIGTGSVICMSETVFPLNRENYTIPVELIWGVTNVKTNQVHT